MTNDLNNIPAAACPRCGGWSNCGGMSQHAGAVEPVQGRTGCTCNKGVTLDLVHEATIAEHWVCAIEYGDETGLEEGEEEVLAAWLEDYPGCTFEWGERSEFAKDDVSGLMASCVEVKIWRAKP